MKRRTYRVVPWGFQGLALFACTSAAFAGVNSWTVVGPDGGGAFSVAFHPTQAGVVLAGTRGGIYRSTDAALNWVAIGDDLLNAASRIVFDPTNPNRVFATSGKFYRSDDTGVSFGETGDAPDNGNLQVIAFSADGGKLYGGTSSGKVFRSTNLGQQWTEFSTGLPTGSTSVVHLAVDPANGDIVYAVINGGTYKTTDGGASWTAFGSLQPGDIARWIAIDPTNPNRIVQATALGIQRSVDGGLNWTMPVAGNFVWVGFDPSSPTSIVAVAGTGMVARSTDSGAHWTHGAALQETIYAAFDPLHANTLAVTTQSGVAISTDLGTSFQYRVRGIRAGTVSAFAAASDGSGTVYAACYPGPTGVFRRGPSGWEAVNNASLQNANLSTSPFGVTALAVDPSDGNTLYAAEFGGLVKSTDGGSSWFKPSGTLDGNILNDVVLDPADSQVVYVSTTLNGVFKSTNAGATWQPFSTGLPAGIGPLAIDPLSSNTLYAAKWPSSPTSVFKTVDGGLHWNPTGAISTSSQFYKLTVDPSDPAVIYAASPGALLKSANGGSTWAEMNLGPLSAFALLVDPVIPQNLIVVNAPNETGALRSVDGGSSWERLPLLTRSGVHFLTRAILDPLNPSTVIAGAEGLGIVEFAIAPDLAVSIQGLSSAVVPLGIASSIGLQVTNQGPFAASAVELNASVPAGFTISSVTPTRGSCTHTTSSVQCNFGIIRKNESTTATMAFSSGATVASGNISATATAHEPDLDSANNSKNLVVESAEVADLAVTLSSSPTSANTGNPITLTATAVNQGPNDATAVHAEVRVASGLTVETVTSSAGSCSTSAGVVNCTFPSLNASANATITVNARTAAAGSFTPTASITSAGHDPSASNNSTTASVSVADKSSGGGGAIDWAVLSLLFGTAFFHRSNRRRVSALRCRWRCGQKPGSPSPPWPMATGL